MGKRNLIAPLALRGRPLMLIPMEKFDLHFDKYFLTKVKNISEKRNISIASVIRELSALGIDSYLEKST